MKTPSSLLLFYLLFHASIACSQLPAEYTRNVRMGEELYRKQQYATSARAYSLAFAANEGKGSSDDSYNAACSYALAGNKDSSFLFLRKATRSGYSDYDHITTDSDLASLHDDSRWHRLLRKVKKNKKKEESHFLKPAVSILIAILRDDQKYREGISDLIRKEGISSAVVQAQLKAMRDADSVNLVKLSALLDRYGWLGYEKVGKEGALTIFLVIQHSPLSVQQKYLPMMRDAVSKKQASPSHLALLEDRVALGEGRKQIYGSQVGYDTVTKKNFLRPLEDPDHVDDRRAAVGLEPLSDYLKRIGVEWDLEEYKKSQAKKD